MGLKRGMEDVPLQQHPRYGEALRRMGFEVTRHLDRGSGLGALIQHRRIGPLRLSLLNRGPCWSMDAHPGHLAALPDWGSPGAMMVVNAEDSAQAELLRAAGFGRLMTPAAVAELSLAQDDATQRARLHQKWRNRLARAEDHQPKIRRCPLQSPNGAWFLAGVAAQGRARRYRTYPAAFLEGLEETGGNLLRLTLTEAKGDITAAILTAEAGDRTTYIAGLTTQRGRDTHAHNLLLWSAITRAIGRGQTTFDLGLADDQNAPGLTRFKRGTGAHIRPLGGTWIAPPRWLSALRQRPRAAA